MSDDRKITDPAEILRLLMDAARAAENQAVTSPEESLRWEMHKYYGDMFAATVRRIESILTEDGWCWTAQRFSGDGKVSLDLWRIDLREAAILDEQAVK